MEVEVEVVIVVDELYVVEVEEDSVEEVLEVLDETYASYPEGL